MSRSNAAVSHGEPPRRQRSRAYIGRKRRGKCRPVSDRSAATRELASATATLSSPIPAGTQQPPTGRIPCPEGLGAHARFHAARLRPSDPKPDPALLGRAGSHAGELPARAATLFRVLRPMRSARESAFSRRAASSLAARAERFRASASRSRATHSHGQGGGGDPGDLARQRRAERNEGGAAVRARPRLRLVEGEPGGPDLLQGDESRSVHRAPLPYLLKSSLSLLLIG